jgi:predicted transport protein
MLHSKMAGPEDRKSRPSFETSVESRFLRDRLRKLVPAETVNYRELNELIGMDVQKEAGHLLYRVRRALLRDEGIVTKARPNVGIERLTDIEATLDSAGTMRRIRNLTNRGVEQLAAVDYEKLPQDIRTIRDANLAAFAVQKLMSKPKSLDRIAAAIPAGGELPIARTLELFRGPKKA